MSTRRWLIRHAGAWLRLGPGLARLLEPIAARVTEARPRTLLRVLTRIEARLKGWMFNCRMCGDCVLGKTGLVCPMNCPKRVRNGPCGGVRSDGSCEVDPSMPCVWLQAWESMQAAGRTEDYNEFRRPADQRTLGRSSWLREPGIDAFERVAGDRPDVRERQAGALRSLLARGRFVVTAEVSPPDSADPLSLAERSLPLAGLVDAVNLTDASGANCHLSSLSCAVLLRDLGFTPIAQFTCRDRNRIALQGDILGAAALGVENLLCLTGDGVGAGDQSGAKPVFDLDSVSLLRVVRSMRDHARFMSGRKLAAAPQLFLGAALNPFCGPLELQVRRLRLKVDAGAEFVQTQYCFDIDRLLAFVRMLGETDLLARCHLIVGLGPLGSARTAVWMNEHVPGVSIPEGVIRRLRGARDAESEGRRICIELIQQVREIPGVSGVHLMAHKRPELVAELIRTSGLRVDRRLLRAR